MRPVGNALELKLCKIPTIGTQSENQTLPTGNISLEAQSSLAVGHFTFNNPEQLLALIRSFLEPEEELKRILFYVSEPFTEVEPRIKSNKKEELEEYKEKNPKEYEEKVNKSGIIQSFNHAIAQQNQVKLRVGRVKFKFVYKFEDKEVYNGLEAKIFIPYLKLRQKQVDALLAHDITKLFAPNKEGVFCCSAGIPILCLC